MSLCLQEATFGTDVADPTSLLMSIKGRPHLAKVEAVIRLGRVAFHVFAPAAVFAVAFYLGLMLVR